MKFKHKLPTGYSDSEDFNTQKANLAKRIYDMRRAGVSVSTIADKCKVSERVVMRFWNNEVAKYYDITRADERRMTRIAQLDALFELSAEDASDGDRAAHALALKTNKELRDAERDLIGVEPNRSVVDVIHQGAINSSINVSGEIVQTNIQEIGQRAAEALNKFTQSKDAEERAARNTHVPTNDISHLLPDTRKRELAPAEDIIDAELVESLHTVAEKIKKKRD